MFDKRGERSAACEKGGGGGNLSAFNALNNSVSYHRQALLFLVAPAVVGKLVTQWRLLFLCSGSPAWSLEVVGQDRPEVWEHQARRPISIVFPAQHAGLLGHVGWSQGVPLPPPGRNTTLNLLLSGSALLSQLDACF